VSLQYDDFDLQITPLPGGRYRVHLNGPSGQASGDFVLPFTDMDFGNFLGRIGQVRRSTRRSDGPEVNAAKEFGGKLFNAVFSGEMIAQLRSSVEQTQDRERGLRIRLRLTDAPELADLPWEFLYDSAQNHFLTTSTETPVVRFLDLPQRVMPLKASLPLRVLVVIASPRNLKRLDAEGEWLRLQDALGDLLRSGQIVLERLPAATLDALRLRARGAPFHIFHFIGHGGFDQQAEDGVLQFEDVDEDGNPTGMSRPVRGERLGVLLRDHRSLRLAVLNACEGARGSRRDPFSGVAQSLLQQRVPAVIAMQFEISDLAAKVFAREFYCAIAGGNPVDAAVCESRKALFNEDFGQEWATPVLYMRSHEGTLFDLVPAGAAVPEPPRTGEHIVVDAARKAAELAEAARASEAARVAEAAASAERERAEKERIENERAEQARIESAKAEKAAADKRAKEEAKRREGEQRDREEQLAQQIASENEAREKMRKYEAQTAAETSAATATHSTRPDGAPIAVVASNDPASSVARDDRKGTFPTWQIGAGGVILALLLALSWHHLRPHSHSDEENGSAIANSSQAPAPQSVAAASSSQNASSAHREPDGSMSSSGGASSGSGGRGGSDATAAKRKDGVRESKNRDSGTGSGAPSGNTGAVGTTNPNGNAASNTSSGAANAAGPLTSRNGSNTDSNAVDGASATGSTSPLHVNAAVQDAKLVKRVSPVYPAQAAQNHISGMVVLDVLIAKDGTVRSVTVTSGDPALGTSAMDAVKQRRYEPTLVNGQTVEVETTVSVDFAIKDAAAAGGGTAVATSGGTSPSLPSGPPAITAGPNSNLSSSGSVSIAASSKSSADAKAAPCTLGNVAFQENGAIIVGTVPFTYSGSAKLQTLAVVGFPAGADKKRIAGIKLAETTLQSASGNASFSMESHPSLSGGTTGEYVEVVVVVKATGEAMCRKLAPYLHNW
jgi:TonB family protein